MQNKSVCVFCGSRNGKNLAFEEAAVALGSRIAEKNWRLVYGAGSVGLMGLLANAAQKGGGDILGVIPINLLEIEVGKTDLEQLIVTENMHERKKVMYMNSNAFVLLPGGIGSLEEFFEVFTWSQLSIHKKPIAVLNIEGYWDPLNSLIEHLIENNFANSSLKKLFKLTATVDETIEFLTKTFD